jgi:predicted Zn-dependent protease
MRQSKGAACPRAVAGSLICLASAALLAGCETTTSGGAVGAEGQQLMLVSSEELNQAAAQGYAKLKAEAAAKGILNKDRALLARVTAITNRLTPQTRTFRADAPAWKWEVNVISSPQVNAFCMPGGKIMVYSGIVDKLKLSDDELAFVLGHEMAHALREHSREQVSQSAAAQTAIGLGAALLGLGQGAASLANIGYDAFIATRFSRGDEAEADRIGVELAARAGYDPHASVAVWQKMAAASASSGTPEFLSTHPTDASRTQALQALLPKVTPLYEASRRR